MTPGNPATRAALAGIRRRPRQALLTGLAVLVATVFAAGTVLFTGTMREALLADSVRTPPGAAYVVDRAGDADIAALADRLAAVPGVTGAVPSSPEYEPDRVDIAGAPDRAALHAVADGARVRTADVARADEADEVASSVQAVLAGLSVFVGLALVAAVVVVGSTFRIVLGRRGRELAMLRCVGASRGQVTRSVLAEAGATGLVTGVAGTGVALGGAYATLAALRVSGVDVPALVPAWGGLAGCVLLAVAATVLAAVPPALAAGRVPPVVALGAAEATEARGPRAGRRLPLVAVLVTLAAGTAALGVSATDSLTALTLVALSGLVLFAALVAAGPFLVAAAASALRPLAARSGPARLAVANARRVSRRTAATTTVLALGVGLTAALLVGIDGASADARASIERNYPADVLVRPGDDDPGPAARLTDRPELTVRTDGAEVLVDGAPGADPAAVRAAVAEATGGSGATVVWTADERAETEGMFGTVRAVGGGLVGVTLVVAVLGVGVTLALSVDERTRETALLRALGLTRSGARRAVAAEAALAGAVGAVLGVLLGAVYGVLGLVAVGMSVPVPPVGQLAGLGIGVVAVAVLASAVSMRRAAAVAPAHGLAAG